MKWQLSLIHLIIKGNKRRDLQNFFRVVAGHIAQEILREFPILPIERAKSGGAQAAEESQASKTREKENKFWQTRVYSRIVSWGREYLNVKKYVIQNALEALGIIPYKTRAKQRPAKKLKLNIKNTS
ncbi:MAG: hypothetical protein ABL930_12385 [Pseudobdellovibrio sp.]